jgi:diguanylate cyclase (GGDEF)-like protein
MFLVSVSALNARRHGSINAWYQIGGWTPTMVVGLVKILAYALPGNPPLDGTVIVQFCLAIQVLVATMGIISRFVVLRVERDRATARAEEMEGVAGRDALTGLWNRRSIEQRFDELFAKGFRTMAVLDLDHFKSVNDFHGHGVGDSVLKAAATALASDADTRGVRIGGEEFLLLLRGPDSAERAERCRRAISTRIAAGVPGLDRVVTASMGLIEHDAEWALDVDFDALYEQCDKMLYDAKRLGRNRTMSQKLTSFMPERRALPI